MPSSNEAMGPMNQPEANLTSSPQSNRQAQRPTMSGLMANVLEEIGRRDPEDADLLQVAERLRASEGARSF